MGSLKSFGFFILGIILMIFSLGLMLYKWWLGIIVFLIGFYLAIWKNSKLVG